MFTNVFNYLSENNVIENETTAIVSFSSNKIVFFVLSEKIPANIIRLDEFIIEDDLKDVGLLSTEFLNLYKDYVKSFDNIKVIKVFFSVDFYALIPEELYNENEKKLYLEFLYGEKDFFDSQIDVSVVDLTNKNFLLTVVPEWQKKCVAKIDKPKILQNQVNTYITNILVDKNKRGVFVNVYDNNFDIIIKDETIKYCNRFSFETAKDFCYFIIGVIKTVNWNSFEEKIYFSGNIMQESELINLVKRYFKEIIFLNLENIKIPNDIYLHRYFNQLS